MQEKVALVTGANRGLGRAIALRFASEGALVIAAQRSPAPHDDVAEEIRRAGGQCLPVIMDVCDEKSVVAGIGCAVEVTGGLDILCANAGVGQAKSLLECTAAEFDDVLRPNVRGVFLCLRHAIPAMLERGGGSVIVMASIASIAPLAHSAAYVTSKAALLGLTRQVALDYASAGVRVNAIAPGFVQTDMFTRYVNETGDPEAALADVLSTIPLGRVGLPEDVANAAVFLASDEANWVTGSVLVVDGGTLLRN